MSKLQLYERFITDFPPKSVIKLLENAFQSVFLHVLSRKLVEKLLECIKISSSTTEKTREEPVFLQLLHAKVARNRLI